MEHLKFGLAFILTFLVLLVLILATSAILIALIATFFYLYMVIIHPKEKASFLGICEDCLHLLPFLLLVSGAFWLVSFLSLIIQT